MLEEFGEGILAQHQCIEAVNSHWIQGWLSDLCTGQELRAGFPLETKRWNLGGSAFR